MTELYRESVRRARLLAKEESGVALMLTLSVFLLLYVACAGVYAVGETVRQKIELQNACDSAAYSAAVVQADGLSRMAMVNRALSWTYVQLTNLQMDYITYRWLKKARDNFKEDRDKCEKYNKESLFIDLACGCSGECRHRYVGEGKGWFCGVSGLMGLGAQSGKICMNGKVMDFDSLDQLVQRCAFMEEYGATIKQLKNSINTYNLFLPLLNTAMQHSIPATASATLYANLPQTTDEDGNSEIDKEIGKDFLWYVKHGYSEDPYQRFEEGDTYYGGYFSPLYNTEAGERIFLTMADGACYDRLEPYFSNGNTERMESGGLDQWFIRSYPAESAASNITSIESKLWKEETGDPWQDSYKAPGICRVYKNANRQEGGSVLRGHHTGTLLLDTPASCVNKREAFPEQCGAVDETVALCAEYEWSAAKMYTICYWKGKGWFRLPYHTQYGLVKNSCPHLCCHGLGRSRSHTRSGYDTCFRNDTIYAAIQTAVAYRKRWVTHPYINLGSYIKNPYGFARIYGDDRDIYDKETYTGTPAKPWILKDSFYSTDGAIIVGLARRQRNPFLALFDSLADGLKDKDDEVKGIYSAFNPVTNAYVTAFSAARAAYRFHPSASQWKVIQASNPVHSLPDRREYETRYDAVCHDDILRDTELYGKWTEGGYSDGNFKLWLDCPNEDLRGMHVGCVCKNEANKLRFARCWNLCESDWDATLLPVAYAQAGTSPWFDSYLHNKDAGGGRNEQGNVFWKSIEDQKKDTEYNPFEDAAVVVSWLPFFDEDGALVTDEGENPEMEDGKLKGTVDGKDFLQMKAPRKMPGEKLGLSELIKQRIL